MSRPIAPGVHLVGGPQLSDGSDCLCYALDLGVPVLIDCGCGPGWPAIRDNMRACGLEPAALHTLVLTHCHVDHIGAAPRVKEETACRVVAHDLDASAIETGDEDRTAASWYSMTLSPMTVDHRVQGHEESLVFEGGALHLLHTPGHTPGSMVAWLDTEAGRVLFGQDIHGPFAEAFGSDKKAWRASMQEILALQADVLCEGHFGVYRGRAAVRDFIDSYLRRF